MSRSELLWSVLTFQMKLAVDGFRDVILVPISLIAALIGLVSSTERPGRYYQRILHVGRRSEYWINLFGFRHGSGTSDELLTPLQEKLFSQAENSPALRKAGQSVNRSLDKSVASVEQAINRQQKSPPTSDETEK